MIRISDILFRTLNQLIIEQNSDQNIIGFIQDKQQAHNLDKQWPEYHGYLTYDIRQSFVRQNSDQKNKEILQETQTTHD